MTIRKRKSEETEARILEVALKLFSEQGYSGTATSQIATEADVSEGTIFKYFPKKIDLLKQVLYRFLDKYSAQIVLKPLEEIYELHKQEPPEVLLKAIVKDRIAMFEKMDVFLKVLLTEMQYHPELKDLFVEKVLTGALAYGEKTVAHFQTIGYFRDLPPALPIRSFIGAVGMMVLQRKLAPELGSSQMSLDEEIDQVINIFLYGVMKAGGVSEN